MRCEYLKDNQLCNRETSKQDKYCIKHKGTLQARKKKMSVISLNNIDFISNGENIIAYLEKLKILPLQLGHIKMLEDNGYSVDKTIKEKF